MPEPSPLIVHVRDAARVPMREGRGESLRLIDGPDIAALSLRINTLRTDVLGPYHRHTVSDNLYYLLSGRIRVDSGELSEVLEPGDAAFIPAGTPHSATNIGNGPAQLLELYCPGNADFVDAEIERETGPGHV